RRRRVPVHGARPPRLRAAPRNSDCLPGGLRRARDWSVAHHRRVVPGRQRVRPRLHARPAVRIELPRRDRGAVAVFRRLLEPWGAGTTLRRFPARPPRALPFRRRSKEPPMSLRFPLQALAAGLVLTCCIAARPTAAAPAPAAVRPLIPRTLLFGNSPR